LAISKSYNSFSIRDPSDLGGLPGVVGCLLVVHDGQNSFVVDR
jgi:hypothetical protein